MSALPKLLATRRLPEAVTARACASFAVLLNSEDMILSQEDIIARAAGQAALLVTPGDRLDATLIEALPASVRMIATFSVGHEHIDLAACRRRGIVVTNTPDVLTEATADIALLLMLGAARRVFEGERAVRDGLWRAWSTTYMLGRQVSGKRLGILGMGRIGQALARRARALEMRIHYHNRRRLPPELELGAVYHAVADAMLPECDFLSLHAPGGAETRHWLNAARIAHLPDGAVVVNTARGSLIDDVALIAALRSGKLFAAGLDVFENEPDLHPAYRELTNVFLLPHLGSATVETRDAMGFRALDNLEAFFAGRQPPDRLA